MVQGIEIRDAHFPGSAPIDAYGNGGFRFADMSHKGSIICIPSGIYGLALGAAIPTMADIDQVLQEADGIEILLIGTGEKLMRLPKDVRTALQTRNISTDTMSTGAAVRTYNVLLAENRAVAAILYAVE